MAAALARNQLTRRAVPNDITSAGFLDGGMSAAPGAVRVLHELGIDLTDHVSTRIEPRDLVAADVVITMENSHILDLASVDPFAAKHAISLRDAAATISETPAPPLTSDELRGWIARSQPDLTTVLDSNSDIPDPMGRSLRHFRQVRDLIGDLIEQLFDQWFGPISG